MGLGFTQDSLNIRGESLLFGNASLDVKRLIIWKRIVLMAHTCVISSDLLPTEEQQSRIQKSTMMGRGADRVAATYDEQLLCDEERSAVGVVVTGPFVNLPPPTEDDPSMNSQYTTTSTSTSTTTATFTELTSTMKNVILKKQVLCGMLECVHITLGKV